MTEELNLAPCPFCGSQAVLHDRAGWEIDCSNDECCAHMVLFGPEKEPLVAAWNSRTHQPAESAGTVDDLAMLTRQLVHALRKTDNSAALCEHALDYLKRKGLAGSPLRATEAESAATRPDLDQVRANYWVNVGDEKTAPETVVRIANLIHAIEIGDYPSTLLGYLREWLGKEKAKAESADPEFAAMVEAGTKAWADVPKASEWVDELRGGAESAGPDQFASAGKMVADESASGQAILDESNHSGKFNSSIDNTCEPTTQMILARQVADWRREIARLHDLVAHATVAAESAGQLTDLPPLPKPVAYVEADDMTRVPEADYFTADQMRDYARAALNAVRAQEDGVAEWPELPRNYGRFNINGPDEHRIRGWTQEQMQEYGQACARAALKAAQAPGWISVDDHLPKDSEDGVPCLVVHNTANGPDIRIDCWGDGCWYQHNENYEHWEVVGGYRLCPPPSAPTHWMLLPAAPTKAEGAQG